MRKTWHCFRVGTLRGLRGSVMGMIEAFIPSPMLTSPIRPTWLPPVFQLSCVAPLSLKRANLLWKSSRANIAIGCDIALKTTAAGRKRRFESRQKVVMSHYEHPENHCAILKVKAGRLLHVIPTMRQETIL